MDNNFANQLLDEVMMNIDISLIVVLMAVGFIIKHSKLFSKVANNIIPTALFTCSIIVLLFKNGFNPETFITTIISAMINAAVAIGLHQYGKNIFNVVILNLLGKSNDKTPEETLEELEVDKEELEFEAEEEIEIEE